MKLTAWLSHLTPKKGRTPQPPNKVPFIPIMTMKLKDRVSGKSDTKKDASCLQEMTLLIACLTAHEYENKMCQKQADSLTACYGKYLKDSAAARKAAQKGLLVAGERNMTFKQVKNLFRMRPML